MNDQIETRLQNAMANRADYGMTYTDTQKELQRFKNRLAGNRRARRTHVAMTLAGAVAATIAALALVLTLTSGDTRKATTPGTRRLPSDYPAGTWVRVGHDQNQGQLAFSNDAMARLQDFIGHNTEPLTFPGRHLMTFGPSREQNYCSTSGTYSYIVSAQRLRFQFVRDGCAARRTFLTHQVWQEASP